jgi:hypothetical protein
VMRQVISACAQLYVLLSGWASHFWEMLFTWHELLDSMDVYLIK